MNNTDKDPVSLALEALTELAEEAQDNGNSLEWINSQKAPIIAALQQIKDQRAPWSIKVDGDIARIFDGTGKSITSVYTYDAKVIVDAHNRISLVPYHGVKLADCSNCGGQVIVDIDTYVIKDQQAQPVEQEARLLNELAEAARCQGVAQAKNDKHANEYWTKKVDALVSSGYITDAQQAQPVDKQKREFGGIEWELVYMPAGWTSIIDELIFAHKGEKYLEFRTTLAAAPRYAPVEQAHGAMPDYWVREDILFKLNDSRKVLIETHESANEFTNCTYQGKHVYKVTALYTSPPPSPQADKEVVGYATFSVNQFPVLQSDVRLPDGRYALCRCDTAEPAKEQVRDDVIEECAKACELQYTCMGSLPDDPPYDAVLINETVHSCVDAIRQLKEQSNGK